MQKSSAVKRARAMRLFTGTTVAASPIAQVFPQAHVNQDATGTDLHEVICGQAGKPY